MRDGLGDGRPEPGGNEAVPPWQVPGSREPGPASVNPPYRPVPGAGHRAHAAPGRGPGGGRWWLRLLLLLGLFAGAAGLVLSVIGVVIQLVPRSFTAAQRDQIVSWEIGKRWREWPAGQIFPSAITYSLPARTFGDGQALSLTAQRVGIAPQATCRDAAERAAAGVLAQHGCLAVLRATYEDTTQTLAVTVGVAVLPAMSAAQKSAAALGTGSGSRSGIKAVSFRRTATAHFGDRSQKLWWNRAAGPYLVLATVGYADGRPWIARGDDTYTQDELLGLAYGAGQRIAAALGAAPPAPSCPGNPAC
jgi:hypothetical protein